jgi:hypothetical protein
METKLDAILELAREPEPSDEPFVGRVMVTVRADAERRWRRRRAIARPAILGVAAVLVTGGAVAAFVRSIGPDQAADVNVRTTRGAAVTARPSTRTTAAPASTEFPTQAVAGDGPGSETFRRDDLEWGYTSEHSAYVLDTRTGLRLQTETYVNEVTTGRPHVVTLTLANLGDRPIGISSGEGCALSVAAYHSDERGGGDPSAFDNPTSPKDPQSSNTWCATGGKQQPEKFVLRPGDVRTADIRIVLSQSGNWAVLGMCRCTYGRGESGPTRPTPEKDAVNELDRVGVDVPALPSPLVSNERDSKRLFTPPIRVLAR